MKRALGLLTAVLLGALLTACGGEGDAREGDVSPTAASTVAGEFVSFEAKTGVVQRPADWTVQPPSAGPTHVGQFVHKDAGGQPVEQLDVFIGEAPPGTKADAVMAAVQGNRAGQLLDLREVRREFTSVPGAASGFIEETTYLLPDGRTKARSIDKVAVDEQGRIFRIRISGKDSAFDRALADTVLGSMRMKGPG